jgi:hypothetical protein
MPSFLTAVIFAVIVAAGAAFVLERQFLEPAEQAFTTTGARLSS